MVSEYAKIGEGHAGQLSFSRASLGYRRVFALLRGISVYLDYSLTLRKVREAKKRHTHDMHTPYYTYLFDRP